MFLTPIERVIDAKRRTTRPNGRYRKPPALAVPRARGIYELDAGHVRIGSRARQLADDVTSGRVRNIQINGQQSSRRQEGDPFSVRADRRPDIHAGALI